MYKHNNEALFDSVIIKEFNPAISGFKPVHIFGVNSEEKSKKIYQGFIDGIKMSPSCQFDFNQDGGITVFCIDFSQPNSLGKIFITESDTKEIIALKDCE